MRPPAALARRGHDATATDEADVAADTTQHSGWACHSCNTVVRMLGTVVAGEIGHTWSMFFASCDEAAVAGGEWALLHLVPA